MTTRWPDLAEPAAPGWDHLQVGEDDPEKRIADLERRLAEQKRGTDLPPASPDHAAESRRFVASTSRPKTWLKIATWASFAAFLALFVLMYVAPRALGKTTGWVVVGVVAFALIVFPAVFYLLGVRRWGASRKIPICVMSDGLTVDQGSGEVFSFTDATLGLWTLGHTSSMSGTALHLRCGPHRFVLGGEDHRVGTATPLEAPPTDCVDGWVRAADFDEVLTMVARRSGLDVRGPAPGEPLRCLLFPRSQLEKPMGPFEFRVKQRPPQPHLAIDVGTDAIRVIDPNTKALIASASRPQVTVTPAGYKTYSDEGRRIVPVLVVRVPGLQPLTIKCRRAWRGEVPEEQTEPEFVVSDADWLTLVDKFGLAPYLEDSGRLRNR